MRALRPSHCARRCFNRNLGGRGMAFRHPNERKPRTHCWNNGSGRSAYGGFSGVDGAQWQKVVWGLFISGVLGFALGAAAQWLTKLLLHHAPQGFFGRHSGLPRRAPRFAWRAGWAKVHWRFAAGPRLCHGANRRDVRSAAALADAAFGRGDGAWHGDGRAAHHPQNGIRSGAPFPPAGLCNGPCGFALPAAANGFGVPVSTTHTKTAAILGVGAASPESHVHWHTAREMLFAWLCTFPGCGLIGF